MWDVMIFAGFYFTFPIFFNKLTNEAYSYKKYSGHFWSASLFNSNHKTTKKFGGAMRFWGFGILTGILLLSLFACEKEKHILQTDSDDQSNLNYPSLKLFLDADSFLQAGWGAQDIDLNDSALYCRPFGRHGIWRYDFNSHEKKQLFSDGTGNYIALDSTHLYYDVELYKIKRYNLQTGSIDPQFKIRERPWSVFGMDMVEDTLYVLWGEVQDWLFIKKYDRQGAPADSIPYGYRMSFYMTIRSDVLYSVNYTNYTISRFNLSSATFLKPRPWPTGTLPDGIRIYHDLFLLTSFNQQNGIFSVDLNEIQ